MPPREDELRARLERLSRRLAAEGADAALVRHPLHLYYLSGTFADGHLIVTSRGEALLLVYRSLSRAREEASGVDEVTPLRSLRDLPGVLRDLGARVVALEEDRLPQAVFRRYERLLADFSLADLGPLLRAMRAVKSPYEVSCQRRAAEMLAEALGAFLPRVAAGRTELELAGELERELRRRGHPARTRTASFLQELAYGHLLSGKEAATPSYLTTGQGGRGVEGFPQGPGWRRLAEGDLLLVDYAGWHEGYLVDQTRLFCLGEPPPRAEDLFARVTALLEGLEAELRPGVVAAELYHRARELARELGVEPWFMAHGEEGVPFVGHGVGLEIDEWPPIAPGVEVPLEEGMVIALEPKLHLPDLGVIGLEDTFLVTASGAERLTRYPRALARLSP